MMELAPPTNQPVDSMMTTAEPRLLSPVGNNSFNPVARRISDASPIAPSRRRSVEDVSEDDLKKLHASIPHPADTSKKPSPLKTPLGHSQSWPSEATSGTADQKPKLPARSHSQEIPRGGSDTGAKSISPIGECPTVDSVPTLPTRMLSVEIPEYSCEVKSSPKQSLETADNAAMLKESSGLGYCAICNSCEVCSEHAVGGTPSSVDNLPTLPTRMLSCDLDDALLEEDDLHNNATTHDTNQGILSEAIRVVQSPHLEPIVEREFDVRVEVLSRIPKHVKTLLSMKEWYRILEPTRWNGTKPDSATACSDFSDGLGASNRSEDTQSSLPESPDNVIYDDVYGTDEEKLTVRSRQTKDDRVPKTEKAKLGTRGRMRDEPMRAERKAADVTRKSWDDTYLQEYDAKFTRSEMEILERATSPVRSGKKKRVSFGTVHVRHYERALERHPCTSSGPSIGLGWNYFAESEEDIKWTTPKRRFVLTRREREIIVTDLGYSKRKIAKAIRKNLKIKRRRRRTVHNLQDSVMNVPRVEYAAEKARRKLWKLHRKLRWQ